MGLHLGRVAKAMETSLNPSASAAVTQEIQEGVAVLRFNRPDALNALDSNMRKGIVAALGAMASREDVRAIVLTGAGRAFAAGVDRKEAQSVRPEYVEAWFGEMRDVYQAHRLAEKRVAVGLNRLAVAEGLR